MRDFALVKRVWEIRMRFAKLYSCIAVMILSSAVGVYNASAQAFLAQDWALDPENSHVYFQVVKKETVIAKHKFTIIDGTVDKNGDATVKIDLNSVETNVDILNVRLRFLLFETFKFPYAEITAKLDKSKLQSLANPTPVSYPLTLQVAMHGMAETIQTSVRVTRVSDSAVSVETVDPIVVAAETFGFTKGIEKLSEAVGGINIKPAAEITFDLKFVAGGLKTQVDAAREIRQQSQAAKEAAIIPNEDCENRLSVISQAGAIYFKFGSAELTSDSAPLLNSAADIASRCPSVKFSVEGHTDNVGGKLYNQELSEQRAKSVVDYLIAKGVATARIKSVGYGGTRPVAANDNEADRAKNRRIEFKATN
jgi:OmpA-OmpF porin, OOP family